MKKGLLIGVVMVLALTACGSKNSFGDNTAEIKLKKCNEENNILDFSKVSKITMLSFENPDVSKTIYSHEVSNTLNDFYRHGGFYESAFRAYSRVSTNCKYEKSKTKKSIDDFISEKQGHFVVIDFMSDESIPGLSGQYKTIIYNAENGNWWCGSDRKNLYVCNQCSSDDFKADRNLLEIIEGKWALPKYGNVVEFLVSGDWFGDQYTEEEIKDLEYFEWLESLDG